MANTLNTVTHSRDAHTPPAASVAHLMTGSDSNGHKRGKYAQLGRVQPALTPGAWNPLLVLILCVSWPRLWDGRAEQSDAARRLWEVRQSIGDAP